MKFMKMSPETLYFLKRSGQTLAFFIQYGCMYHCFTTYGFTIIRCGGKSMEPTIYTGDAFIVNRYTVFGQKLQRGDIVGLRSLDDPNKYLCKRLVAMEGDRVFNNVSQEYVWVPKGHVWIEGDNKGSSHDSRHFGAVPYGLLFCKLMFRVWTSKEHKINMTKDR